MKNIQSLLLSKSRENILELNEVFSFQFCWNIRMSQFSSTDVRTFLISHYSVKNSMPQGLKNISAQVNNIPLPVYLLCITLLLLTLKQCCEHTCKWNWSCFCSACSRLSVVKDEWKKEGEREKKWRRTKARLFFVLHSSQFLVTLASRKIFCTTYPATDAPISTLVKLNLHTFNFIDR